MYINWTGLGTLIYQEVRRSLRVAVQTLITPWVSALLYILIFGAIVGRTIADIQGVSYIDFVLPGILTMSVIGSAFAHSSSSLYMQRFLRHIEELLIAPLSHTEMILGYVVGSIARGVTVGIGVLAIAVFFGAAQFSNFFLFLWYIVAVSAVFGIAGVLVGLWAESFEQFASLNTFVIMPLSFVGGVFNSIDMLPEKWQTIAQWNPFFYFVDGIRYSMIGISEGSMLIGTIMMVGLIAVLWVVAFVLFERGWHLRA